MCRKYTSMVFWDKAMKNERLNSGKSFMSLHMLQFALIALMLKELQ